MVGDVELAWSGRSRRLWAGSNQCCTGDTFGAAGIFVAAAGTVGRRFGSFAERAASAWRALDLGCWRACLRSRRHEH